MVGNNAYSDESGYEMPTRCHNDILLLRQILTRCCKIKEENIFSYRDISLSECHDYFKQFLNTIDKDSLIIIFYSGHGDNDGSLVFTDGAKRIPDEFRRHINSFSNDTVLFIDACYSGNNEGPLDFLQAEQPFKSDCIGIYSSLAHLTAKEISYQNIFFKSAIPFYRDVLSINHIEGNGYFTALPGLFFTN